MSNKYVDFKRRIKNAEKILILSHKGPDLDAFCSMLILLNTLKNIYPQKNITAKVKQYPNIKLPSMKNLKLVESIDYENEDLVIIVDIPEFRLCIDPKVDNLDDSKFPIIFIDHHKQSIEDREKDLIINEERSSATEQVYVTLKESFGKKFIINNDIAALVQYGIVSDTGRFLYDTVSAQTHRIFAEVKDIYSVDLDNFVYKNSKFPREATPIIIQFLKTLKIEKEMSYMIISREFIEENNLKKHSVSHAEAFLRDNFLRFIQGVHWGFIVGPKFDDDNKWHVSFRSTKGYQDVSKIAQEIGGGGHKYSSAAIITAQNSDEAIELILGAVNKITS